MAPPKHGFQKPKNVGATFARLLGYLGKSKFLLILVFLLVAMSAVAGVAGTYFIKSITDDYLLPLVGSGITRELLAPLAKTLALLAGIYIAGVLSSFGYSRIMLQVSQNTLNTIRADLFNHMQDLPVSFFDTHTHGELMSRYTNDVDALRECISQSLVQLVSSVVTVIGTFAMMLRLSPLLMLVVLVMLVMAFGAIKFLGSRSARYFREQQKCVGDVNGYIEEFIEGQKVVKVFCHEQRANADFSVINGRLRHASTNAHTFASVLMPIMGNISYLTYAAVAMLGSVLIVALPQGSFFVITVGTLLAFLTYTKQFFQPITQISQQFNNIIMALAGAERIFEIIDTPPEADDGYVTLVNAKKAPDGSLTECRERTGVWAWKHPHGDGTITYTEWRGDVRFHDVSFSYDGQKTVLKHVSLYAMPGQKIAFVGSTGAGKTTAADIFREKGYYIIDADVLSRKAVESRAVKDSLCARFGSDIIVDGELDRRELARRAFASPEATAALNAITHPEITRLAVIEIHKAQDSGAKAAVIDAALLFESDLACLCGKTVCITADDSVRLRRIIERDGLSETDALMRIAAQPPQEFYAKQSDIIIDNGDGTDLRKAIDCLF